MRLPLMQVDKYVASPYFPSSTATNPFPTDPTQYFTVQIQVHEDDGSIPNEATSIFVGDRMALRRVQYWYDDANNTNFTTDVWIGSEIKTNDTGYIKFYVAISNFQELQYPGCIFDLFASLTNPNPGRRLQSGLSQTLVCCYTDLTGAARTGTLTSLAISTASDNMVAIPDWTAPLASAYGVTVTLGSLDTSTNPSGRLALVLNGKRADAGGYQYSALLTGVQIPYQLMRNDPSGLNPNVLVYVVDDGIGKTAIPTSFPVDGVPLVMPNPTRQQIWKQPWWLNAEEGQPPSNQPLTMDDLLDNGGLGRGLIINFRLQEGVKPGDLYSMYVYLNGYKGQLQRTQVLGDGSSLAGVDQVGPNIITYRVVEGDEAGDLKYVKITLDTLQYFGAKDFAEPGYMWFSYQINGETWSRSYSGNYSPVGIDFEAVPPTRKHKRTDR